jgi:thiol-disulfide isomerase/thioredoxin
LRPLSSAPLIACLPLMLALGIAGCDKAKPANEQASAGNTALASSAPAQPAAPAAADEKLDRSHKGEAMPGMPFVAPDGAPATLGGFRGHPVLVNLWATWCGPCVKELPALDALSAREVGKLSVVAVSQDMDGPAKVPGFWKAHGIKSLTAYTDSKMALTNALKANELPVTVLYDGKGKEVWRVSGGLDWTGDKAAKLIAEAS